MEVSELEAGVRGDLGRLAKAATRGATAVLARTLAAEEPIEMLGHGTVQGGLRRPHLVALTDRRLVVCGESGVIFDAPRSTVAAKASMSLLSRGNLEARSVDGQIVTLSIDAPKGFGKRIAEKCPESAVAVPKASNEQLAAVTSMLSAWERSGKGPELLASSLVGDERPLVAMDGQIKGRGRLGKWIVLATDRRLLAVTQDGTSRVEADWGDVIAISGQNLEGANRLIGATLPGMVAGVGSQVTVVTTNGPMNITDVGKRAADWVVTASALVQRAQSARG